MDKLAFQTGFPLIAGVSVTLRKDPRPVMLGRKLWRAKSHGERHVEPDSRRYKYAEKLPIVGIEPQNLAPHILEAGVHPDVCAVKVSVRSNGDASGKDQSCRAVGNQSSDEGPIIEKLLYLARKRTGIDGIDQKEPACIAVARGAQDTSQQ